MLCPWWPTLPPSVEITRLSACPPVDNAFGTRAEIGLGQIMSDPETSAESAHGVIGIERIDLQSRGPVADRNRCRRADVRRVDVAVRG